MADLDRALAVLHQAPVTPSPGPGRPVSAWTANLAFVRALGFTAELRALNRLSRLDGPRLRLPRYFGSEVIAHELGLVHNYPSELDGLERSRGETIRMADLVGMLDRALGVGDIARLRLSRYRTIVLPPMSIPRATVAQAALAQVGMPYIWGGDWPTARSPWGAQAHAGFDCSGLAWWALKGAATSNAMALGRSIVGRTADQMAFEPGGDRIDPKIAMPGDLVFFGPKGPATPKGRIDHMAVSLGYGWVVQATGSRGGVSVSHLDDYWPAGTAFARRVVELGL